METTPTPPWPGLYRVVLCSALFLISISGLRAQCQLDYTCPSLNGGLFGCIDDVPAPDPNVVVVLDSCGPVTITIETSSSGFGCVFDTLFVSYAYIINDGTNEDTCIQVFAVVDETTGTITCPPDTIINCNESSLPDNTGQPVATDECDPTPDILYFDYEGIPPVTSPEMRWVPLDGESENGSCVSESLCDSNIICLGLQYTPGVSGILSSYTTGFLLPCIDSTIPITYNQSCVMADNSLITADCSLNIILMNSSGNTGQIPVKAHVPIILHQVCFQFDPDSVLILDEDESTDLSTSITLPDGTPISELPAYTNYTVDQAEACDTTCPYPIVLYRQFVSCDDCGNASTCLQQITIQDTTPPLVICPANLTLTCGASTSPDVTGVATVADNCDDAVLTATFTDNVIAGACPANFTVQRTWRATDECGNIGTCLQTILVQDIIPPTLTCPMNTTVSCATAIPIPAPGSIPASDNCSAVSVTFVNDVTVSQTCLNRLTINRTYRATDACGNSTTCVQTITVNDVTVPTITCPMNVTVACISNVPAPNGVGVVTSDNCSGPVTVTHVSDQFSNTICENRRTITRTYRATDACGNSATCAQIITVNDQQPPFITCPMGVTVNCASAVPPVNTGSVSSTDNCGGVPPTITHVSDVTVTQTCTNRYTLVRTYRATDVCNNSATCTQTIVVNDVIPPTITCPGPVNVSCASQVPAPNPMTVGAADNCSGGVMVVFVSDVTVNQTCANRYMIQRTYRASDACNNSATCVQVITVNDITPPAITCPGNTTVSCANQVPAVNVNDVTVSDICGGIPAVTHISDVTTSQTCLNRYTLTRTYQAMDACGNTATCTQIITVNDQTPPSLTCPGPVTVQCHADVPIPNTSLVTTTDNCTGNVTVSFISDVTVNQVCPNQYTINRTYRAMDICGNSATCVQAITVADNTLPTIICPAPVTVQCPADVPSPEQTLPASDNCFGPVIVTFVNDVTVNQTCPNRYTINRTYRATDGCSNSNTCVQVITVHDDTPPVLTCPANLTVDCAGDIPAPATGLPASDNCGGVPVITYLGETTITQQCVNNYTIMRTYRATDICGNSATCTHTIVVFDDDAPEVICPVDITVDCDADVPAPDINSVTVVDSCGGLPVVEFVSDIVTDSACANGYIVNRTYRATDECGNSATCVQLITVADTIPPVLSCPDNVTLSCIEELPVPDPNVVSGTDNCGDAVIVTSITDVVSDSFCIHNVTITRTYEAEDACGNTATCSQAFIIFDNVAPTLTCPDDITVACFDEVPGPDTSTVSGTDNCTGDIVINFLSDITVTQSCPNQYVIARTYGAFDVCGNSTTCQQLIVVNDTIVPVITCPVDTLVTCATAVPPAVPEEVAVTDNCGAATVAHTGDIITNDSCANRFTVVRTYTATDVCGNTATCIQVINVFDDVAPLMTCPDDITLSTEESTLPDNTGSASATDNCEGEIQVDYSDITLTGECVGEYDIIRTWTSTDVCGNTSTCEQQVFISIGCFVDLSLTKELGALQPSIINPGDDVTYTITVSNDGNVPIGSVTIVDYIPVGFSLNDPDWTPGTEGSTGQSASIVLSIANGALPPGGLIPGETISVDIILASSPDIAGGYYINVAEIAAVFGIDGEDLTDQDSDSQPDTDDVNDPPGEDDHDPAAICILFDPVITGPVIVCQGDVTSYGVEIFNPAHSYTWTITEGGIITESTDSTITVLWTGELGDTITIVVTEVAGEGCVFTDSLEVYIGELGPLACIDHINLSLSNDCETVILPSQILVGEHLANENYIVYVIDMHGDTVPNATVSCEHLGQTFMVSVRNICSGQSCWGNMTVEDKLPPIIDCICSSPTGEGSCSISCLIVDDIIAGHIPPELQPVVVDDCCGASIEIVNIELTYETCDTGNVLIEWLATDGMGNTSTCVQSINVLPLVLGDLRFPPEYLGDCDDSADPSNTGRPQLGDIILDPNEPSCNIMTRYEDQVIPMCGDGRKIIRRWTVTDWCTSESRTVMQAILLIDRAGPVLVCPPDITVNASPWTCNANITVTPPAMSDACSDITSVQLFGPLGLVTPVNGVYVIPNVPLGTSQVRWVVRDECLNESVCTYNITVVDNVPPVVACNHHTVVSLTSDRTDGLTLVPASSLNDHSFDNCGPVTFRAARMNSCITFDWTTNGACVDDIPNHIFNGFDAGTGYADCFPVACCDVGNTIIVLLEVQDASGNANTCMVEVEVQDKLDPTLTCPPDITISCDYLVDVVPGEYSDVNGNNDGVLDEDPLSAVFGTMYDGFRHDPSERDPVIINDPGNPDLHQPYNWGLDGFASDNCEVDLTVTVSVIDDCSGNALPANAPDGAVKLIRRTFVGNDGIQSGSCSQRIWVVDYTPFFITDTTCENENPNDGVIWPCDVLITSCPDEINGTGEPLIIEDNCSLVGVTYDDTQFDFAEGACYKILREWKVIDWCQFNPATGYGLWTYIQEIRVMDSQAPDFIDCPAPLLEICTTDPGVSLPSNNQLFLGEGDPDASSCSVHVTLSQDVHDGCSAELWYDVKLYLYNGPTYIQLVPETLLELDADQHGTMSFNTANSAIPSIAENGLPYTDPLCNSNHRLVWTVSDGCGNQDSCSYLLRIEDCKAPSPVCIDGLSSVVMESNGQVTLEADFFNASSVDDCTPGDELLFSFSGSTYQPEFTYTCANVPEFGVPFDVSIWVADAGVDQNCNGAIEWSERNKDFCVASLVITDPNEVCGEQQGNILTGVIMTEQTEAISPVIVNLSAPGLIFPGFTTSPSGEYAFTNIPDGYDCVITPARNDDPKNGVSTLDLVHIQKHLLGLQPFESPFQYIAADANNSSSISAIDLLELRKLILGIYPVLPNNTSWRFVREEPAGLSIPPWPLTESIAVDELQMSESQSHDFTGIKVGDVNATAKANAAQLLPRNANPIMKVKVIPHGTFKTGQTVEYKFVLPAGTQGFQWTLELAGLSYLGVKSNVIPIDDSNVGVIREGLITMSWNGEVAPGLEGEEVVFIVLGRVETAMDAADMIRMTSEVTEAEAYDAAGSTWLPKLDLDHDAPFVEFALYQNKPNPWEGNTLIEFDLPADAFTTLTVYDITGKVIAVREGSYKAGHNMIMLSQSEIPSPGVLYYRLDSGGYSATKKMMVIR